MKKIARLLLAGLMVLTIASCGNSDKKIRTSSLEETNSEVTESVFVSESQSSVADISSENGSGVSKNLYVSSEKSNVTSSKTVAASSKSSSSDVTTAKNVFQGDGFTMKMPDGWKTMNQSGVTMLVPNDYPNTADNISIVKTDKDSNFSAYTKEVFESTYKSLFEDLNITTFEKTTVNSCAAYHIVYNVTVSNISMKQEQYLIDGTNCCLTLTFTSVQNDISALAKECVQSVKFS